MARTISIGNQSFADIREKGCFLVDKTSFIKEWWENRDPITLITRPRRFGKTLNMNMLECFFSLKYADRSDLFEGLSVWNDGSYRSIQGTYPVINMTFSAIKTSWFDAMAAGIRSKIVDLYEEFRFVTEGDLLSKGEKEQFRKLTMGETGAYDANSLQKLCGYLERYYGKKVIVLLDEYDAPMQEAWMHHYWDEAAQFLRGLFNATFKENTHLERAVITGVTRISKESLFSDLNNLKIVSIRSHLYTGCFGFTEEEVFAAMDEFGYTNKEEVRRWYDGFTFGEQTGIYNPWSVTSMLKEKGETKAYWANTSSNALAGQLIREGTAGLKKDFETLLAGGSIISPIDEEIVFQNMNASEAAVWSILLASGYLKAEKADEDVRSKKCRLELTNYEVQDLFEGLVGDWFSNGDAHYNDFIKALLMNDIRWMNRFMNDVALTTFSSFDSGTKPSDQAEPERFYHGFVLGLLVELKDRYSVTSNRESGFGRYDVMLEPLDKAEDAAYILEFKVMDRDAGEKTLEDTVQSALRQIDEKEYVTTLTAKGIPEDHIYRYGFAFEGKNVLIGA